MRRSLDSRKGTDGRGIPSALLIHRAGDNAEQSSYIHLKAPIFFRLLSIDLLTKAQVVLREVIYQLPLDIFISKIIYLSNLTRAQDTFYRYQTLYFLFLVFFFLFARWRGFSQAGVKSVIPACASKARSQAITLLLWFQPAILSSSFPRP